LQKKSLSPISSTLPATQTRIVGVETQKKAHQLGEFEEPERISLLRRIQEHGEEQEHAERHGSLRYIARAVQHQDQGFRKRHETYQQQELEERRRKQELEEQRTKQEFEERRRKQDQKTTRQHDEILKRTKTLPAIRTPSYKAAKLSREGEQIRTVVRRTAQELGVSPDALLRYTTFFKPENIRLQDEKTTEFPECSSAVKELFVNWIKSPRKPIKYKVGNYSGEPWISNAAEACVLARELGSVDFEKYALSEIIQNCAMAIFGPWKHIERKALLKTPLRRFSDHWIAWNCHFTGRPDNEYRGLIAARMASLVGPETRDPRTFDLIHWYDVCGDTLNPECSHHAINRQQQREAERLRNRPFPLEEGREWELLNRRTHHRDIYRG